MVAAIAAAKAKGDAMQNVEDIVAIRPSAGTRATFAFQFFLGSLYVVVEAWRRFNHSDPEIDALLADEHRVEQLHEARDKIFHPGDADDPIKAFHPANRDRTAWAPKLHLALIRYCRAHFEDFGDADRAEISESLAQEEEDRRQAGLPPDTGAVDLLAALKRNAER
jgi:hypothetical protein